MITFSKSQIIILNSWMFSANEGTKLIPVIDVDGVTHTFTVFNKEYQDHTRTIISLDGNIIWKGSLPNVNGIYGYPSMQRPERYGFKYTVID